MKVIPTYQPTKKNATEAKLKTLAESGDNWVEIIIPVVTVSEANGGPKRLFGNKERLTTRANIGQTNTSGTRSRKE